MRNYSSVNRSYGTPARRPSSASGNAGRKRRPSSSLQHSGQGGYGGQRRPVGRKKRRPAVNKKLLIAIIAAVVAVIVIIACVNAAGNEQKQTEMAGLIAKNVTIEGVPVGGMNSSQAVSALDAVQKEKTDGSVLLLEVPAGNAEEPDGEDADENSGDNSYNGIAVPENMQIVEYPASKSGVHADVDKAVQDALAYSETVKDKSDEELTQMGTHDIPLNLTVDETLLAMSIAADSEEWNIQPVSSTFGLEASSSEENLTTNAKPITTEAENGISVDVDAFVALISEKVNAQNTEEVIVAPTTVEQPSDTAVDVSAYDVIGQYSTEFSSKQTNRCYNIWKISSILNGTVIPAGETMSVNDIVGPRTEKLGWKLASGIENGMFTDQAGGGICQVSTTIYIAALKAEMKIVERRHHTIPSTYVPLGLDATISTDSPDLKIQNNTDYPMHLAVICDVHGGTVAAKLYGINPRDYYLRFENKIIETTPAIETKYISDSTVPEGTFVEEGSTREGYTVEVYKVWYDKNTDQETDRKRIYTDTYKNLGKTVKYNPATPPAELQETIPEPAPPEQTTEPDPVDGPIPAA